jgi:FkbM family methyltransferase
VQSWCRSCRWTVSTSREGPTLLKLDVQGFEFEFIAGAGHLLELVDVIVVEFSLHPF